MIKVLRPWGYKSRTAFFKDLNVDNKVFNEMVRHSDWQVQKAALLHKKCPSSARLYVINSSPGNSRWYKRLVAYFSPYSEYEIWIMAETDSDKRIQKLFDRQANYEQRLSKYIDDASHEILLGGDDDS